MKVAKLKKLKKDDVIYHKVLGNCKVKQVVDATDVVVAIRKINPNSLFRFSRYNMVLNNLLPKGCYFYEGSYTCPDWHNGVFTTFYKQNTAIALMLDPLTDYGKNALMANTINDLRPELIQPYRPVKDGLPIDFAIGDEVKILWEGDTCWGGIRVEKYTGVVNGFSRDVVSVKIKLGNKYLSRSNFNCYNGINTFNKDWRFDDEKQ